MLKKEIGTSYLKDVPDLLPALFPDTCLPLPPAQILEALSNGPSPLYKNERWVGCPRLTEASLDGDIERALVVFLQTLGDRVAKVCEEAGKPLPPKKCAWTAKHADRGVKGAPNVRKPDLLFGNGDFHWQDIDVHAELKSNDFTKTQNEAFLQLLNGAYLMFSSQDNRRFIVSLAFMATTIRVHIFDRAGLVVAAPFHLHKDPEIFLRVMVALMFTNDPAVLGYDTSITETDDGRFIEVAGVEYEIIKTLFISDVVRGRGTVCWHARHGDRDFVIKDTWADDSRPHTEAEILRIAHGVEGVPKVIADVIVKTNGVEGSTRTLRSTIDKLDNTVETRVHRRIVLTPLGEKISTFATRKELLAVLLDAVMAHRDLFNDVKILHRDISIDNIVLVPMPPSTAGAPDDSPSVDIAGSAKSLRRGLLIDVDYALVLDENGERGAVATGHRTGTLPFMAVEVLYAKGGKAIAHQPRHDLESLLYVLVWVCVLYAGPGDVERQNWDLQASSLSQWVSGSDYRTIGMLKDSAMRNVVFWEDEVLGAFAPYFAPLKPCVSAWKDLYVAENLTYEAVLGVLRNGLDSLDDMEVWSKADDPAGYGDEKKRKLAPVAEEEEEDVEVDEGDARAGKTIRNTVRHIYAPSDPTGFQPGLAKRMKTRQIGRPPSNPYPS
ncbi:hypothetical protein C8R47DRAFT_295054 [Mycena vitilis]|nr:hypothetical protein C8R47DRAFT_295054 [Mycena vitilis]